MPEKPPCSPSDFSQHVHDALAHLYDPAYLQTHPLASLAAHEPAGRAPARGRSLRQEIVAAIESLRPGSEEPVGTRAWRGHQVLSLRYVEGLTVAAVCRRNLRYSNRVQGLPGR